MKKNISVELAKLKTSSDKRLALKIQLNFQNRVSETKCDKSLSCMSSGGKIRPLNELVDIFLTAMWLPHSQLWATTEDAVSLT